MRNPSRRSGGHALLVVPFILVLSSCASVEGTHSTVPASAPASIECQDTGRVAKFGLDGKSCADSGFTPTSDGFAFPNWGARGALDSAQLVRMFGRDGVCVEGAGPKCTLLPAAASWMGQMNDAMRNGHCEGMSVLSERIYSGEQSATSMEGGASGSIRLDFEDPAVIDELEYWWTTQAVPRVYKETSKSHALTPTQIAIEAAHGIRNKTHYTLGAYSDSGGAHAVTPIAVVQRLDKTYSIVVYDSNQPGRFGFIAIDPATESWTLEDAATSPSAKASTWRGSGRGSLDLTPMAPREGTFTPPFLEKDPGTRSALVTSPDGKGGLDVIVRGSGASERLNTGTAGAGHDYAKVASLRSGLVEAGAIYSGPDSAEVAFHQVTGRALTVGLATAHTRTTAVLGESARPGSVRLTPKSDMEVVAGGDPAYVEVDNGTRAARVAIDRGQVAVVKARAGGGTVTVEIEDETGELVGEYDVDEGEDSDVTEVEVVIDDDGSVTEQDVMWIDGDPETSTDGVDEEVVDEGDAGTDEPDVSEPDVSEPDVSEPDVSEPDVSQPDVSQPDVSEPDVSEPDVSQPSVDPPSELAPADQSADGAQSDVPATE